MNLVQLFDILFRRQRRVFVLVTLAAFLLAAAATFTLQKEYRGIATLFVGENRPLSAGADAVQLDDVLARTYSALLTTATTQRQVAARLPGTTSGQLENAVSVKVVPGTRLLQISALDPSPRQAQKIANTYAEVFVEAQQSSLTQASRSRLQSLDRRIGDLGSELDRLKTETGSENAGRRAQVESDLEALRESYIATQQSTTLQGQNVSVSSLSVVPPIPAKPRRKLLLALALVFSLVLGAAAAMVRNLFDKRIRDEEELIELLGGVPILARVPLTRGAGDSRGMNEAFDFLRANLRLSGAEVPARMIAITSSLPGDGKSTVCMRLARAYAQQGTDVVVADCDLRKPMIGTYFGVSGLAGVTNVLVAGGSAVDGLVETQMRGVRVLPAGPVPPNPSILLGLPRFGSIMEELRSAADYVIVDTPPVPAGVDTSAVSQVVDGVVLVIDLNRSNRNALAMTRDQLAKAQARLLGVVINRVTDRATQYGYGYGSDYEAPAEPPARPAAAPAK